MTARATWRAVGAALAGAITLSCGKSPPRAPDRARASLLEQARVCEAGNPTACLVVALRFERGIGAAVDLTTSRAAWTRACALGAAHACTQLGFRLERGAPFTRDLPGAASAYRRACDGRDALGCYGLGEALYAGYDSAPAEDEARALWGRLCVARMGLACSRLGDELAKGGHPAEALRLWRRGCALDSRGACQKAKMLERHAPGLGVEHAEGDLEL